MPLRDGRQTVTSVAVRPRAASGSTVLHGVTVLVVLSLMGAAISVAGELSPSWAHALGPTGRLSIPWPMMVFQVGMAVAAGSARRRVALVGSGAVALALLVGVVSGFFDGGYADARMTPGERGYQMVLVAALVVVGAVAARRFGQVRATR